MEMPDSLSSNIAFKLTDIARQYRILFDREMNPLGLTRSQWWALAHVYYYDGINQKDLADLLDIDKSAVGKLLHKLEEKHWVTRKPDESDGRAYNIFLTKKVLRLMEQITRLSDMMVNDSLVDLSDRELATLNKVIKKLSHRLSELNDDWPKETKSLRKKIEKSIEKDLAALK